MVSRWVIRFMAEERARTTGLKSLGGFEIKSEILPAVSLAFPGYAGLKLLLNMMLLIKKEDKILE